MTPSCSYKESKGEWLYYPSTYPSGRKATAQCHSAHHQSHPRAFSLCQGGSHKVSQWINRQRCYQSRHAGGASCSRPKLTQLTWRSPCQAAYWEVLLFRQKASQGQGICALQSSAGPPFRWLCNGAGTRKNFRVLLSPLSS